MQEIIEEVARRAEVSEEVARRAVEVVVDVLREKLPGPLANQAEDILSGEADLGDIAKGLGDLLGG